MVAKGHLLPDSAGAFGLRLFLDFCDLSISAKRRGAPASKADLCAEVWRLDIIFCIYIQSIADILGSC